MFDCFNNALQIGDTVAFIYNVTTSSWLEKGIVIGFSKTFVKIEFTNSLNRTETVRKSINKVVKI